MNKETLIKNQEFVKEVITLAKGETKADFSVDGAFNNRPKEGGESATQAVVIAVDQNTTRNLPLEVAVANKHCRLLNCKHDNEHCKKNYSIEDSICSA